MAVHVGRHDGFLGRRSKGLPPRSGIGRGTAATLRAASGIGRGKYDLVVSPRAAIGRGVSITYAQASGVGRGVKIIFAQAGGVGRGRYAVLSPLRAAIGRGEYRIGAGRWEGQGRGAYGIATLRTGIAGRGMYRIANEALRVYELYRGVDTAPDFDSAPWESWTADTATHETAALDADHTYHFVLRLRNEWDLVSYVIDEWELVVDGDGDAEATKPTGPEETSVDPGAALTADVAAVYLYAFDDEDVRATKWAIWLTDDGSNPDPDNDAVTDEVDMVQMDGTAGLNWTSDAFDEGDTVKVVVRTRRVDAGPVNVDSDNTTIYSCVVTAVGPVVGAVGVHFGTAAGERQG